MSRGLILTLTAIAVVGLTVGTSFAFTPQGVASIPDVIISDQTPTNSNTPGSILTSSDTLENQGAGVDIFDFPNAFNLFDLISDVGSDGSAGEASSALTYEFISSPGASHPTATYTTDDRISINGTTISSSTITAVDLTPASGEVTLKDEVLSTDSGAETKVTAGTLTYAFGPNNHPTYTGSFQGDVTAALIDTNIITVIVSNSTQSVMDDITVWTVDDGPDALSGSKIISTTKVDLGAWEFSPQLVTAFGSFTGDTITTSKAADDGSDGSVNDLTVASTGALTGQAFVNWASPPDAIAYNDGVTYRTIWQLNATGFASTAAIPQLRLRANYGFTGSIGNSDVVIPESNTAPPSIGSSTTYDLIFDEFDAASANATTVLDATTGGIFQGQTSTENAKRLFLDWVDFQDPSSLGGGTIELECVIVQVVNKSALLAAGTNEATVADWSLTGADIAAFGGSLNLSGASTMTAAGGATSATITSTGTNGNSQFNLFNTLPLILDVEGVAMLPFAPSQPAAERIYRFSSDVGVSTATVPQIRLIVNAFDTGASVNTLSTETIVNGVQIGPEANAASTSGTQNPALTGNVGSFSSYLRLPSNQQTFGGTVGDAIQGSVTAIDQDDPYVAAGTITINSMAIDSFPGSCLP
jgi:hypothetical protein